MPLRILVVDDNDYVRQGIVMLLEMSGHEVVEATNGNDALNRMRQQPPDGMVLDLNMPRISGRSVLRERAADPALSAIPVIISSSENPEPNDQLLSGVCLFLQKPYAIEELESAIAECFMQQQPV